MLRLTTSEPSFTVMDPKLLFLVLLVLAAVVHHQVDAEFFYQRVIPKPDEVKGLNLTCSPGRTTIRIEEDTPETLLTVTDSEDDTRETLRSHMNMGSKEEVCKVCVCSVDGKDEYCSQRPAVNVNECLRMTRIVKEFQSYIPYDHTRNLAFRIRRDYIWHNDEIPYDAKAKCKRSHSYYSNNVSANDTDIDVASDIESILDYADKDICYYCVCSVSGNQVGCISRQPWFCEYYRHFRKVDASKNAYAKLLQQDRPTYFRQLSWRMRRMMDEGMYDFLHTVGDEDLQIHADKCIPFVSEYTDCTEENRCTGCNRCTCTADSTWSCRPITDCGDEEVVDEISFDQALNSIKNELRQQSNEASSRATYLPRRQDSLEDKDLLLAEGEQEILDIEQEIQAMMRTKRSVDQRNQTDDRAKDYHTVDELNEDTLKTQNITGIIQAHQLDVMSTPNLASRRTGLLKTDDLSKSSLQIKYNQPKVYDNHITDNKIDTAVPNQDRYNVIHKERIGKLIGNYTQKQKDKNLSKLVVNELKPGAEVIGDKKAPVISNITFTPENDTLTAMAFIAGNLLNKLWKMEKDSGEDSKEAEALKHAKIADLLDIFKEPLNLRQENFLKNALKHLSEAVDKSETLQNVTFCDPASKTGKNRLDTISHTDKYEDNVNTNIRTTTENSINTAMIFKMNNILSLITKFQNIQNNLNNLKKSTFRYRSTLTNKFSKPSEHSSLTHEDSESLNLFGNILEKITKLLLPPKKSKKICKSISNINIFKNPYDIIRTLKETHKIDVNEESLTDKDKFVFDYLNSIQKSPKCLLENWQNSNIKQISGVEGDILLNLSDFLKVKSFVDLISLIEPQSKINTQNADETTRQSEKLTETITTTATSTREVTPENGDKFVKTKERLKEHLKNIIDDLIEIQNAKGQNPKNISIVDALPCILKMLNDDNNTQVKPKMVSKVDKVTAIFDSLKKHLKSNQNRRSNSMNVPRSKSAVVWERVVKNGDGKNKQRSRRLMKRNDPKTYQELKNQIDQVEFSSKIYKHKVLVSGVPPAERLTLLKTLLEEIRKNIQILDDIDTSLPYLNDISVYKKRDLNDFVDNAAATINLNKNLVKNINNLGTRKDHTEKRLDKIEKQGNYGNVERSMKMVDSTVINNKSNMKLSRDATINQLIKNRMQLYVKIKESKGSDLSADINYGIAKKILGYLDIGNYGLARELYKILISEKQSGIGTPNHRFQFTKQSEILNKEPEPLDEPKNQFIQEPWLRQLINLKNMRA